MSRLKSIAKVETAEDLDRIVGHLVDELKEYDFVDAIILFGSYARGEARPLSDIDICVITKKDIDFWKEVHIAGSYPDKVDITIFWKLPLVIQFRVFKDGKVLYCRDKMTLHRIKVKTIREYLDFQHIIERWIKREFPNA